jgi:hydrogenase-4 component A
MTTKFVIADPKKCIGCYTCMPACVVVHQEAGLQAYPRLHVTHTPHGTMPMQCRHCEDAPCSKACPAGCFKITDEVQLNESLCIGCKMCVLACPFGVIEPHGTGTQNEQMPILPYVPPGGSPIPYSSEPTTPATAPLSALLAWTQGVRTVAVKCDLCYFREEGPACIQVCPTKALRMVDPDEIEATIADKRQKSIASAAAFALQTALGN